MFSNVTIKISLKSVDMNYCIIQFFAVICIYCMFVNVKQVKGSSKSDNHKPTDQMISAEGYPVETHWVTTADGYILCLHRIPSGKYRKKNKKVALLQHGLFLSSSDWILFGPGNSFGYILADNGYDVWMGNTRGNMYSRNHSTLDPNIDLSFWNFSWHEMGYYDLPAMIDYILGKTKVDGLYYAGHSQGTTSFFVMTSMKPDYNKKIKVQVSLSPVAYMKHLASPIMQIISLFEKPLSYLSRKLKIYEVVPMGSFPQKLIENFCLLGIIGKSVCISLAFAVCGYSFNGIPLARMPLILGHAPAGVSMRQILHYIQEIKSGHFRQYDFGLIENLKVYKNQTPPDYDLSKVTAPVHLFYSKNDWLVGLIDVERLSDELGNVQEPHLVPERTFNHMDFIYGRYAPKLVYKPALIIFKKYQ